MTSALRWGWSVPRPGRFTPGKDPVPIVQEAGWAPGPVWTGAEISPPTGIRTLDRPARRGSLYRPNYPGPCVSNILSYINILRFLVPLMRRAQTTPFVHFLRGYHLLFHEHMKILAIPAFERVLSPAMKHRNSTGYKNGTAINLLSLAVKATVAMYSRCESRISIFPSCISTNWHNEAASDGIFRQIKVLCPPDMKPLLGPRRIRFELKLFGKILQRSIEANGTWSLFEMLH